MGTEAEDKKVLDEKKDEQQEEVKDLTPDEEQRLADDVLGEAFDGVDPIEEKSSNDSLEGEKGEDGDANKPKTGDKKEEGKGDKDTAGEDDKGEGEEQSEIDPAIQAKFDEQDKRFKDTQQWGNDAHQRAVEGERKNKTLMLEIQALKDKESGVFDETVHQQKIDAINEESAAPQRILDKTDKSKTTVIDLFGQQEVDRLIGNKEDDTPYQRAIKLDPGIPQRMLNSDQPFVEAIKIAKGQEHNETVGSNPKEMMEKVIKDFNDNEKPKLIEDIKKSLMGGNGKGDNLPVGLPPGGSGQGAGDGKNDKSSSTNLSEIFPTAG